MCMKCLLPIGVAIWISGQISIALAKEPMNQPSKYVQGVIEDAGTMCPIMLTDDGTQITLQGIGKHQYPVGTKLLLEGRFVRVSKCMQGVKTLQVEKILNKEPAE